MTFIKKCFNFALLLVISIIIVLFSYSRQTENNIFGISTCLEQTPVKNDCFCNTTQEALKEIVPVPEQEEASQPRIPVPPSTSSTEAPRITTRGSDYWVMYNFAKGMSLSGHNESITYTTHCEYKYLDNLIEILKRWDGPISIAIYAPGEDFRRTIMTINYFRECWVGKHSVREQVNFHVFFPTSHIPKDIDIKKDSDPATADCDQLKEWMLAMPTTSYRQKNGLVYPVNVGRNIARESATTKYVLATDVELYPSPGLIKMFFDMLKEDKPPLNNHTLPRVFVTPIFEIKKNIEMPNNKSDLLTLIQSKDAIVFHKSLCSECHTVPEFEKWLATPPSENMSIIHVAKRHKSRGFWEPIYIGTNADPLYDERLSWDGRRDKMTQALQLCLMDYDFMILSDAFLIHRPGIKTPAENSKLTDRTKVSAQGKLIDGQIIPGIKAIFGNNSEC